MPIILRTAWTSKGMGPGTRVSLRWNWNDRISRRTDVKRLMEDAMLKRAVMIVSTMLLYLSAARASAQVPAVLGVWDLNQEASRLPAQLFPQWLKSEIRSYYMRDDGYL